MKENTKYTIMIVSDQHGDCRQLSVTKRGLLSVVAAIILTIGVLSVLSLGRLQLPAFTSNVEMEELRKDNEALKLANDRYFEASRAMEDKIKLFESKTNQFAMLVGVESLDTGFGGIGGPELIENELDPYLRYDLGLLEQRANRIEDSFDNLEEAFGAQAKLLDSTPSILPARGWISSGYKHRIDPFTKKRTFHAGIDISSPEGTPVLAPADGVVAKKGYEGGFGNMLVINHGNGIKTRYGHLYKFNVSKGQRVKRGEIIAYVGSTGRSTASHLHYEVHKEDRTVNPMKYIIRDSKTF